MSKVAKKKSTAQANTITVSKNSTSNSVSSTNKQAALPNWNKEEVLFDYRIGIRSRQASLLGRREVLSGKAKFGIFGDGKEVAQLAMARSFAKGDFRSGYYRDQTFMFALGISDVQKFYAQLYAHTDVDAEPSSAGRSMNGHFGTRFLHEDGTWKEQSAMYNSSADVSPTGSQMPRLVGLAYASRLYRNVEVLQSQSQFSTNGNEIAWGTIGNASSAEGMFWESVNAIGVLKSPAIISIWDDGYGISVPNDIQLTKGNIGEILRGFEEKDERGGYIMRVVKGWDYPTLVQTYAEVADQVRKEHKPAIIHVIEVTQPQGHSTSGSHERYKSKERLQWEQDFDCLIRMKQWIIDQNLATAEELDSIEKEEIEHVRLAKQTAWDAYMNPIKEEIQSALGLLTHFAQQQQYSQSLLPIVQELQNIREPFRRDIFAAISKALIILRNDSSQEKQQLLAWKNAEYAKNKERYGSHLYSQSEQAISRQTFTAPQYSENSPSVNGSEIINACFDAMLASMPQTLIFGEDVGQLGDVNQGCAGLQEKYGALRVSDTGIREVTILGQAIGLAMRGLRPIAEIQYLDYLLYALQLMSDDLATVQWRTKGGQKAPVIVRTRGHRLEGVWHSGSPMAGIINLVRGMHVCVPRNMTQAAGMYNSLLQSDEPAIVVEVLNGYRLKERLPDNITSMTVPLGVPEILKSGTDITAVTYGATCRPVMDAARSLEELGISVEVIDVQTLLPFDTTGIIVQSLQKTNRIIFIDEDVPGGTTAFMMRQVIECQNGFKWLDSTPATLTAQEHRPAYGTDGNFWSKPEAEHIIEAMYSIMNEANPQQYPPIF
ncbi:MAG TPA: thiamine pyrophosphate-dependent enzyme [Candidatus Kapabacteria bacterium]|nr:thiamine pyrophosphate-dependent enzyme [Candidatus Kapabacteria bacterium]